MTTQEEFINDTISPSLFKIINVDDDNACFYTSLSNIVINSSFYKKYEHF